MANKTASSNATGDRNGSLERAHVQSGRIVPEHLDDKAAENAEETASREVRAQRSKSGNSGAAVEAGHTAEHLRAAREHMSAAARSAMSGLGEARQAAGEALRHGFSEARPELAAAGGEVRAAGGAVMADANQQWQRVRARGSEVLARSEDFVRERPLTAVGIAVASGFLLSRLLSR